MATALITGLRGFTGHYLRSELESTGYTVYGISHTPGKTVDQHEFVADITDANALSTIIKAVQPDVVAHLAGIAYVGHQDVASLYHTNVVGTRCLLQSLAQHAAKLRCVLLASSGNVYGHTTEDPIGEDAPLQPANDYAVSKLAMEYMAKLWMPELPIVIARPFNYTGIGQAKHFLIPKLIDHFVKKAPQVELGNIDIARDFSDVRMLVKAYRQLLELAPCGETFNIGSGQAITLSQIITHISEIAAHPISITQNPALMRANEAKVLRCATTKFERQVASLQPIPLVDTLQWMYQAARGSLA